MTDDAWAEGMKRLVLAFPDRDMSEGYASERGRLYWGHLSELSNEQWLHAVQCAVRTERWFPTIATLLDYAADYSPPIPLLPPSRRTDEEREVSRELAKVWIEKIKRIVENGTP